MSLGSRCRALAIAGLVLLVAGVTAAAVLASRDSEPDGQYSSWDERDWSVGAISPDQRTLTLVYASGGCTGDRGRVEIRQSLSEVRVETVEAREAHNVACTLDLRTGRATGRLRAPLAGRPVTGDRRAKHPLTSLSSAFVRGDRVFLQIPRVTGLRGDEAQRLLRQQGFKVRALRPGDALGEAKGTDPPYRSSIAGDRRPRKPVRLQFE